jgi:hypothetical protein
LARKIKPSFRQKSAKSFSAEIRNSEIRVLVNQGIQAQKAGSQEIHLEQLKGDGAVECPMEGTFNEWLVLTTKGANRIVIRVG